MIGNAIPSGTAASSRTYPLYVVAILVYASRTKGQIGHVALAGRSCLECLEDNVDDALAREDVAI